MRPCSICTHAESRQIALDLLSRVPFRTLQTRYGVSLGALNRHRSRCLPAAVQTAIETESPEPAITGMRRLQSRTLKILSEAEQAKDHLTALNAIREARKNIELLAKLSGELDARSSEPTSLQVHIVYTERSQPAVDASAPVLDAVPAALPEPE